MQLFISFDLLCPDEGKTMLVGNFSHWSPPKMQQSSYNQPMLNASYYQNSPPSSGLLTSFCKADNWLVSIAAADCHPLSLKLKVLLWCGGRACLAGERLLNGDSSVKWNMSEACENKVTLTLSEDHKKTPGTLFRCGLQTKRKVGHNYQNFSQPSG